MINKTFSILILSILFTLTVHAQESLVATSADHTTNYFLVGKVEKKFFHHQAWIKKTPTKENLAAFRKKEIEMKSSHNFSTIGYDKYLYSMDLYEFDWKEKKCRVIEFADYDSNGQVLHTEKAPETKWIDILPETVAYKLATVVCNK